MKKRYDEGGEVDTEEAGMKTAEPEENFKSSTFKEAFADARRAGNKTFMWQGKSYTTELAGSKKEASPKAEPVKPPVSSGPRVGRAGQAAAAKPREYSPEGAESARVRSEKRYEESVKDLSKNPVSRMFKAIRSRGEEDLRSRGYAKGGTASARADGIAKKGKTRGKMY